MSRASVLHLEDSDLDAELVRDRLERENLALDVDRAADRREFVSKLKARRYDIILSDYQVPAFEGLAALELARQEQPDTPFIFLSGTMGEELAVETLKRGATDYILKQRIARLPAAVERAVAESRLRAEQVRIERRAAAILENMTEAFIVLDAEWRFAYVNAAFERLSGVRRQDVLGKDHWEAYPAAVGSRLEAEFRRVAADGGTAEFEHYYEPWGRWFSVKAYPAPEGGLCVQVREVTDAKRAAEQLARSEGRLRAVLEHMPVMLDAFDDDGRILVWNRECERVTGYAAEEVVGNPRALELLYPDAGYRSWMVAEWTRKGHHYREWEWDITCKDGSVRTVAWSNISTDLPIPGWASWGIGVDVTERRRAERELARREEELQTITDAVPALISYVDKDGVYRFVNRQCEQWFGTPRGQVLGRHMRDVLGEEAFAVLCPHIERVLSGERFGFETFTTSRDGGGRHVHVNYVPRVDDGDVVGFFALVADVTESKRTEQTYRESQERLRLALKGGRMGTWDLGLGDNRLTCSDACKANYGRPLDEPFTYEQLVACVHEDDLAQWRQVIETAVARAEDFTIEYRTRWPDGTVHWVHVRGSCVTDGSGAVAGLIGVSIDISDRKRAEEEIAERELRYRLVADAANDAIWDWNLTTDQVVWNEGVRTRFGYAAGEVLPTSAWWIDHVHPDDVGRVTRAIHAHIADGPDTWQDEYRFRRADGTYAVVADRGRVVRDEAGRPLRMVGSMLDLTERRRAEAALKAAEERFAFVRESSGVGFWYCDLPFDVLEWDERVKAHFHLPKDARVTIDTFYARLHPDDRDATRTAIERSIADRTPYDVTYRTVDPETAAERWVRAIGRTTYAQAGSPVRFDGVTVDVTVQKRVEERLARTLDDEKKHASIQERVAAVSRSANAVLSAESIARIVTEEARAIIGAPFAATAYASTEDNTRVVLTTARDVRAGSGRADAAPVIDADLSEAVRRENRPVRAGGLSAGSPCRMAVPLVGHGGKNIGVIQLVGKADGEFTTQDEALLVQLAGVASAGIENARLYERLRDQDRRKDEFLATLAHELRNPLAPIRTGLQVLKAGGDGGHTRKTHEMMERQVAHMVRLIDDLLDVSRITRGKVELKPERVDVRAVFDAALEVSRPLIEAGRHGLFVAGPKEPLPLDADPTRMAQVVSNLLNNAAKYTPEGGRIELSAERDGTQVVIRVRDNGVGIAGDMLPKVFELFTQVGRSIDRSQGGLGIGLALVARLVELHGGTVSAESAGLGEGSTFVVRLPLAAGGMKEAPHAADSRTPPVRPRRILVVDDNVDGAESLAMLLDLLGHTTRTAHNGPEGLTSAQAFLPEVVFLDIGLPGMNGYEVAKQLRKDASLSGVVLVALTGWGTDDDRRRAKEAGFDHHLTKPVDTLDVQELLANLGPTVRK